MDLGIADRRAVVCASSKGLGRASAFSLARAGCAVWINGRDETTLAAAAAEIRAETGARVSSVVADLSTEAGRAALLAACPDPDILVNNNGGPPYRPFSEVGRDEILAGVEANMLAPILLAKAVLPAMTKRGFGRIVNVTSGSVRAPIPGLDVSSGARAGLTAFLAGVAREVARFGVTINHLQPGAFDTDRIRGAVARQAAASGADPGAIHAARRASIPAGRYGRAEEFGEICAFLCSMQAGYVTGQSLLVDGGAFPGAF